MGFITYAELPADEKKKGSDIFKQVKGSLPDEELIWPDEKETAKIIHTAVMKNKDYLWLRECIQGDLRPHLLLLLKGFYLQEQHYAITYETFVTLHQLAEINLTYPTITLLPLNEAMTFLKLEESLAAKFKENHSHIPHGINQNMMKVCVSKNFVIQMTLLYLVHIEQCLHEENYNRLQIVIKENNDFFLRVITTLPDGPNKILCLDLYKRLSYWSREAEILYLTRGKFIKTENFSTIQTLNEQYAFNKKKVSEIIGALISQAPEAKHATADFSPIMQYATHPLLTFFSTPGEKEEWFFIYFPIETLIAYNQAHDLNRMNMMFRYGTITPTQLINQRLIQQREGSLTPYFLKPKTLKVHNKTVTETFYLPYHDLYHWIILNNIPESIEQIICRWIQLLRTQTQQKINKHLWEIADSDMSAFISTITNPHQQLDILFYNTLCDNPLSIENCLLIADFMVNEQKFPNIDNAVLPLLVELKKGREQVKLHLPPGTELLNVAIFLYFTYPDFNPRNVAFAQKIIANLTTASPVTWTVAKEKPNKNNMILSLLFNKKILPIDLIKTIHTELKQCDSGNLAGLFFIIFHAGDLGKALRTLAGQTQEKALMLAMAIILLKHKDTIGLDINEPGPSSQQTALDLAEKANAPTMMTLLRQHDAKNNASNQPAVTQGRTTSLPSTYA